MIRYNDIKALVRDVDRISRNVMPSAVNAAIENFPVDTLVPITTIDEDEKMFEYTPKDRSYIFGANGVQPASCSSTPVDVETSSGDTIRGLTHLYESGYSICMSECKPNSLEELIYEKEFAVATALLYMIYQQLWYGVPELMQYGLINHPLIEVIQSPVAQFKGPERCGGADNCGSTKWEHKTPNEIMKELRSAMRLFTDPQISMSENAYNNSMGVMDDALINNGKYGALRYEIIQDLLSKQKALGFTGDISYFPELDSHADFDNKDIAIVYDRGSLDLMVSPILWRGSDHDLKNVKVFRQVRSGGLRVKNSDAIKIIVGV